MMQMLPAKTGGAANVKADCWSPDGSQLSLMVETNAKGNHFCILEFRPYSKATANSAVVFSWYWWAIGQGKRKVNHDASGTAVPTEC